MIKQVVVREDENIIIMGEDVHGLRVNLFARFGKERVIRGVNYNWKNPNKINELTLLYTCKVGYFKIRTDKY